MKPNTFRSFLNKNFNQITLLFLFLISLNANAQIQRVEPPFWYAGMKNPELQILFYGKNIAEIGRAHV